MGIDGDNIFLVRRKTQNELIWLVITCDRSSIGRSLRGLSCKKVLLAWLEKNGMSVNLDLLGEWPKMVVVVAVETRSCRLVGSENCLSLSVLDEWQRNPFAGGLMVAGVKSCSLASTGYSLLNVYQGVYFVVRLLCST